MAIEHICMTMVPEKKLTESDKKILTDFVKNGGFVHNSQKTLHHIGKIKMTGMLYTIKVIHKNRPKM